MRGDWAVRDRRVETATRIKEINNCVRLLRTVRRYYENDYIMRQSVERCIETLNRRKRRLWVTE